MRAGTAGCIAAARLSEDSDVQVTTLEVVGALKDSRTTVETFGPTADQTIVKLTALIDLLARAQRVMLEATAQGLTS